MKFIEREFIPFILGGDINTYSVARAFYEKYQVRSQVFGKYPTGPSYQSRIISYHANDKIDTDEVFLSTVKRFAKKHQDKKILLIGCGDSYTALISEHKDDLPENVIAPYIDFALMNSLQHKETFYALCDRYGIDHPETFIYSREMGTDYELPFPYPVIFKASDAVQYWKYPFEKQNKVYTLQNKAEMNGVLDDIYGAGYKEKMIIQDMIPGNDEYIWVLTSYSDHNGKVNMMCCGHVLLEEHTPLGRGNHAVIITEPNRRLMSDARHLLDEIGYVGFSNFDIKYDIRDGKYKFFEINTRQGRSNYYVTGSGINIAECVTEDYIYGRQMPFTTAKTEHLWMVVPTAVAFKYVRNPELRARMKKLISRGKYVNPVFMKGDLGMPRLARMLKTHFSHFVKFRKYYS